METVGLWPGLFVDPEREVDGSAEKGGDGRVCGDEGGRSAVAGSLGARKGVAEREVRGWLRENQLREREGLWKKEKKSEGKGAAAAPWRRDRFRVSLLFFFFSNRPPSPFSIFLPPNVQNPLSLVCVEGNYL
jgi:hypothetical protein